jgi:hypothetical protein
MPPAISFLLTECAAILHKSLQAWWALLRVLVPTVIGVKLLQDTGLISWVAAPLAPLMAILDLPPATGLVWATAMCNSIYGGMAVFATLGTPLSTLQATTLGILILLAHSLPVEIQIARLAGARPAFQLALRVLGAIVLAWTFSHTARILGALDQPATMGWMPGPPDPDWWSFAQNQTKNLVGILAIITVLSLGMRLMDALGLTRLAIRLLTPLLRTMGIGTEAALITVAGTVLGLSYGSGLILAETSSGRLTPHDTVAAVSLMGLAHAVIEDTILLSLMGGHISGLLWARLLFAFLVTAALTRWATGLPPSLFFRWLFRPSQLHAPIPTCCPHHVPPEQL